MATRVKGLLGGVLNWAGVNWSSDVVSALGGGGTRGVKAWLRAYKTTTQVRAPVDRIAIDTSTVKFHLKRRIKNQAVGINGKVPATIIHEANANAVEAWILNLLKHPNPRMTGTQFRRLIIVWLEMVGYAPLEIEWEKVRLNGKWTKFPKHLYPIAPHRIISLPTEKKPFFQVRGARGNTVEISPGDIIWLSDIDVLDPYGPGAGTAEAIDDEVSQLTYAGVWNNNFYRQGAHPGTVVGLDGVSPETKKQIEQTWESKYTGIHNAHRTLFVDGKATVSNLGPTHREQDFVQTQQHLGDRCRFNWKMPPELLGDVRNSNRATIQGATQVHQAGNLSWRCLFLEEHLNLFLMPLFGDPDLFLEWANPVQKTEELMHEALTDGWDSGTVTRDEWRMGHQMDPVGDPWGSMWNVPLNMQGYQLSDQPPAPQAPGKAQMEAIRRVYAAAEALCGRDQSDRREGSPRASGGIERDD